MKLRNKLATAVVVAGVLIALLYLNRMYFLQHALGWYTDIVHPRGANIPVPWADGPTQAELPLGKRPPNIVIIVADDMGINDVSMHGGGLTAQGVPTPNIDSIARDGVRFDQGYAGAPVCNVSRAALLTGRYPWRFGMEFVATPPGMTRVGPLLYAEDPNNALHPIIVDMEKAKHAIGFDAMGMPPSEVTLAETLKARGYHTLHIGKWHLGSTPEMRPNHQGFDETLFMEQGLHMHEDSPEVVNSKQDFDPIDKFLWPNMRFATSYNGGKWFEPAKYLADYYTDEAITAIKKNKNRPFLLYLAHWGVHTPLQATRADYDALANIKDHRLRVYAAMVRSIDRSVGRVLQTLKDEGLNENTLVIFTSDNGAPGYLGLPHVNQPYRGWKITMFEGGIRVPYAAKWPGHIAAGTRYQTPMSNIDIMPTAVAAAGGAMPSDRPIDGVNLLPFLTSQPATQPSRALYWRNGPYRAMQEDKWKLIVAERPLKDWLFNLAADPTEKVNLAGQEPQKLAAMKAKMSAHHANMPPPLWASFIQIPIAIDKTSDQRLVPEDEYAYWYN
jgi:uncharacterized sulfatase